MSTLTKWNAFHERDTDWPELERRNQFREFEQLPRKLVPRCDRSRQNGGGARQAAVTVAEWATSVDVSEDAVAAKLVAPGKGLLAADESAPTIEKRFQSVGVESTAETRRAYREILLSTPGLNAFISGVILDDETFRQNAGDGSPLIELLQRQGIMPGIKVDKGAKELAGFFREKITEGLDGLRGRFEEYARLGARFSKWRAVFTVGPGIPTPFGIAANAQALARFAALSQEAGLVPIVETEVLMDGDHTIARHAEVTAQVLDAVFHELFAQRVRIEAILLKANMALPGTSCPQPASLAEVAAATMHCMRQTVPAAVPGIVFLSGGQGDIQATEHLDALNRLGPAPWELSFSFGRALQAPVLKAWSGRAENAAAAQRALRLRARCNSAALHLRRSLRLPPALLAFEASGHELEHDTNAG